MADRRRARYGRPIPFIALSPPHGSLAFFHSLNDLFRSTAVDRMCGGWESVWRLIEMKDGRRASKSDSISSRWWWQPRRSVCGRIIAGFIVLGAPQRLRPVDKRHSFVTLCEEKRTDAPPWNSNDNKRTAEHIQARGGVIRRSDVIFAAIFCPPHRKWMQLVLIIPVQRMLLCYGAFNFTTRFLLWCLFSLVGRQSIRASKPGGGRTDGFCWFAFLATYFYDSVSTDIARLEVTVDI